MSYDAYVVDVKKCKADKKANEADYHTIDHLKGMWLQMRNRLREVYVAQEDDTVDESRAPSKSHRNPCKQRMVQKPIRVGWTIYTNVKIVPMKEVIKLLLTLALQ